MSTPTPTPPPPAPAATQSQPAVLTTPATDGPTTRKGQVANDVHLPSPRSSLRK